MSSYSSPPVGRVPLGNRRRRLSASRASRCRRRLVARPPHPSTVIDAVVEWWAARWLASRRRTPTRGPGGDHAAAEVAWRLAERLGARRSEPGAERGLLRSVSLLAALWGNCGIQRVIDGAGRHRRLAVLTALMTPLVAVLGILGAPGDSPVWVSPSAGGLLAVALCLGWLAVDLLRSASLAVGRRPHLSIIGLAGSVAILAAGRLGPASEPLAPIATSGAALFVSGVAVLTLADARPNYAVDVAGRALIVSGAFGSALAASDGLRNGTEAGAVTLVPVVVIIAFLIGFGVAEARATYRKIRLLRALLR